MKSEIILNFREEKEFAVAIADFKLKNFRIGDIILPKTASVSQATLRKFNTHRNSTGWAALCGAAAGAVLASYFIYWTSGVDYPIDVGGKPFFAFQSALPLIFLSAIFFSAIFTFIAFLVNSRLPAWNREARLRSLIERYDFKESCLIFIKASEPEIEYLMKYYPENYRIISPRK